MSDLKDYTLTKEDVIIIRASLMSHKGLVKKNIDYTLQKEGRYIEGAVDLIHKINYLLTEKLT